MTNYYSKKIGGSTVDGPFFGPMHGPMHGPHILTPCVPINYIVNMPDLDTKNITSEQVEALPEAIQEIITCPITLQIMSDPVMDIRGRTYDRDALVHFLRTRVEAGGTPVDPMDQQPIPYIFIPNMAVRNLIQHYFPTVGGRRKLTKKKKSRKYRKHRKSRKF
jgi:hypothetical protein